MNKEEQIKVNKEICQDFKVYPVEEYEYNGKKCVFIHKPKRNKIRNGVVYGNSKYRRIKANGFNRIRK